MAIWREGRDRSRFYLPFSVLHKDNMECYTDLVPKKQHGVRPCLLFMSTMMHTTQGASPTTESKKGGKQKARVLSDERNWCGLDASSLPVLSSSFEYHQPFASQADANCQPLLWNIFLFSGRERDGTGFPLDWTAIYREFSIKSLALHPFLFFFFFFFVWTARLVFEARRCCVAHPQNLQHPSNLSIALPGRTKPVKWKKKDELAAAAASSIEPFGALPGLTNRKSFNRNGYVFNYWSGKRLRSTEEKNWHR